MSARADRPSPSSENSDGEMTTQETVPVGLVTERCANCGHSVGEDDVYCLSCGVSLIQHALTQLCSHCGKALPREAVFCSSCGKAVARANLAEGTTSSIDLHRTLPFDTSDIQRVAEDEEETALERQSRHPTRRRGRRYLLAISALLLVAGAALAVWWFAFRQPDLRLFDRALSDVSAVATEAQEAVDAIRDPSDLDPFAEDASELQERLDGVLQDAAAIRDEANRVVLEDVGAVQSQYFEELERLALLPSADAQPAEYERVKELAGDLKDVYGDVESADSAFSGPQVSPMPLLAALSDLAQYRKEVLRERAQIRRSNAARAAELKEVEAFVGQVDGIVARYTEARGDLAAWTEKARTVGASLLEGYQVLEQNVDLRTQIRAELAALAAPEAFAADIQNLISVIDDAIGATQAAMRGIDEYLYNFRYRRVSDTPGWVEFQAATNRISDAYSSALGVYEAHKTEEIDRLSKRVPLPEVPE